MTREEICNSMTVQDAVRVLKETNCYGTMDIAKTVIIKALEQQPSERTEERTETHKCDCISRQAVLEITAETGALETQTRVKALPSVTPQLNADILDKIRAEIEGIIQKETVVDNSGGEYESIVSKLDPDDVLQIIDKYKAESEG